MRYRYLFLGSVLSFLFVSCSASSELQLLPDNATNCVSLHVTHGNDKVTDSAELKLREDYSALQLNVTSSVQSLQKFVIEKFGELLSRLTLNETREDGVKSADVAALEGKMFSYMTTLVDEIWNQLHEHTAAVEGIRKENKNLVGENYFLREDVWKLEQQFLSFGEKGLIKGGKSGAPSSRPNSNGTVSGSATGISPSLENTDHNILEDIIQNSPVITEQNRQLEMLKHEVRRILGPTMNSTPLGNNYLPVNPVPDEPTSKPPPPPQPSTFKDCHEIYQSGQTNIGVYTITMDTRQSLKVYCEEGWTVLQRRWDGSQLFNKSWNEYKYGFGSLYGEFWMGNKYINKITKQKNYYLTISVSDYKGRQASMTYSNFSVGDTSKRYSLSFGQYFGTDPEQDGLRGFNNAIFTAKDSSRPFMQPRNCAKNARTESGWWSFECHNDSNLNGPFRRLSWPGFSRLRQVTMKISPDL